MVTLPQASLAVGASKFQGLEHSTVLLAGQVITGLVVSDTVIEARAMAFKAGDQETVSFGGEGVEAEGVTHPANV